MSTTTTTLPGWLATPSAVVVPARRQHRFLTRSLAQTDALLRTLAPDEITRGRWDPRVKLVSALVALIGLAALHSPWLLTGVAVVLIGLCGWRRVLPALAAVAGPVVVVTAVLLVPGLFPAVRPGAVVLPLWPGAGLTAEGLHNAWVVLARVTACLAVAVLLTRTTSWLRLMAALRAVGAPAGFVMIATMAHRYLTVLVDSFVDALLARRARSLGGAGGAEDRGFVGGTIGALLTRSSALAEDVHQAMTARGFSGRLRDPLPSPLRVFDIALGVGCVVASVLVVWGDVLVR